VEDAAREAGDGAAADRVAGAIPSIHANPNEQDPDGGTDKNGKVTVPFPDEIPAMVCPCHFPTVFPEGDESWDYAWFVAVVLHESGHKDSPGGTKNYGKSPKHAKIYKDARDALKKLYKLWKRTRACWCGCERPWPGGGRQLLSAIREMHTQYVHYR
jgi:hypothetical protein